MDKKKRIPGEQPISWPKPEEASRAVRGSFAWSHEISRTRYRGGCARPRPGAGQHRGLPAVTPRAQKDRDAICAHETHLQARPASAARLERREGRGSAHRNRAEPEAARQVPSPATAIGGAGLSRIAGASGVGASMPQLFKKKQLQLAASSARGIEFMQKQISVKLPHGSQMATLTLGIEATLRNVG